MAHITKKLRDVKFGIWKIINIFDFAGMGVTTAILGYADKDVNQAVTKAINNASMGTLNSYEEVDLAEELLNIHKWADQVKFARTGGEACSIAIRIARAATQKKKYYFVDIMVGMIGICLRILIVIH